MPTKEDEQNKSRTAPTTKERREGRDLSLPLLSLPHKDLLIGQRALQALHLLAPLFRLSTNGQHLALQALHLFLQHLRAPQQRVRWWLLGWLAKKGDKHAQRRGGDRNTNKEAPHQLQALRLLSDVLQHRPEPVKLLLFLLQCNTTLLLVLLQLLPECILLLAQALQRAPSSF